MPLQRQILKPGRGRQIGFIACVLVLSWQFMTTIHEAGHAGAAVLSGGIVKAVQLPLLGISSTYVDPNPAPAFVVWAGPVAGCVLPLLLAGLTPRASSQRRLAAFLCGFCLMANGGYIAGGSLDAVGDCAQMYQTGTPQWVMLLFGCVAIVAGLLVWHRLGSPIRFLREPEVITVRRMRCIFLATALVVVCNLLVTHLGHRD